ncbi:hypothetical protein WH96_17180 [Kiloniella spongiae]|uniref:Uncharacterized protein n=1 Tax=Kiloniella spongiae TaxID=1489064 RepID=A0A0H2MBM3_9PROT|nr:hypothetical protein [Kiloniella spongiae]KLN59596.1 hypothetical protein WH96_17180 [Kiloniella spongiae]
MSAVATELSNAQIEFYDLLNQGPPQIVNYWNEGHCRTGELLEAMNFLSRSEKLMAEFYLMVWYGNQKQGFDLTEACSVLDQNNREIIASWVKNPFWP